MSEFKLTPAQAQAVYLRGSSILVSAAAGSGKTRVITERLMSYVTDENAPKNIDSFLIITYTKAAAAELRGRILEELGKRCAKDPQNRRLRHQNELCYRADIGTIHSFCTKLLRRYAHKLSLTPDFRVGDDDICSLLQQRALDKVLDQAYSKIDSWEGFALLADTIGSGRDDSRLEKNIQDLHTRMQSHPYPEKWANEIISSLDVENLTDAGETIWGREIMESAKKSVEFWCGKLDSIWFELNQNMDENEPIIKAYGDSLLETMDGLRELSRSLDLSWDKTSSHLPVPFPRLKPLRSYEFEDRKKRVVSARSNCNKAMSELASQFSCSSSEILEALSRTAPAMQALVELTLEYEKTYQSEKRRLGVLDFSDLEHFAVKLLWDDEKNQPTETAREISQHYTEIMVDEYQDVNEVQELIFKSVSKDETNIFMVGDVKQSIYRFRLADPGIFLSKLNSFPLADNAKEGEARKVLLQQNFRSDKAILNGCNSIFSNIMSPELGDVSYDNESMLYPRDNAPQNGIVKLSVYEVPSSDEEDNPLNKTFYEAEKVAHQIKALVENKETILDGGVERPIEYSDIAILLSAPGTTGGAFMNALSKAGVPVRSDKGGGFFQSPVIMELISLLRIIDDPHDDISLTSVLSSPIFGFSPDDLSLIRSENKNSDFYTALLQRSEKDEKCRRFNETLCKFRNIAPDLLVHELLSLAYNELRLPALYSAGSKSDAGCTELMQLLDLAEAFEADGYKGLHSFLAALERREASGNEPESISASFGNTVTIMSIHRSKGLEFPVVFLAACSKQFNKQDILSSVLIHSELGLGCKLIDTDRGIEYPTLAHNAIKNRINAEMQSEQMRLLYVALTRAKERLYMSCSLPDPQKSIDEMTLESESPLNPELLRKGSSFAPWLIRSALVDNGENISLEVIPYSSNSDELPDTPADITLPEESVSPAELLELTKVLNYEYPYKEAMSLPAKLTATSLPREDDDPQAENAVKEEPKTDIFKLPDLSGQERPLTGAEKGTATHLVMEHMDFEKSSSKEEIQSQIDSMLSKGILNARQAKAVNKTSILRFFASPTGKRLKEASKVYREQRFSILCPAELFYDVEPGEKIMLQGVVDCCIEENGKLVIIDYKTDYVTDENIEEVKKRYKNQLKAYAWAMEHITGKPVSSCILCFLGANRAVEIDPH